MKTQWLLALAVALAVGLVPQHADAKRLGSGKSSGMQRDMPARTAPDAPAGKPAAPAQGQQAAPATPAAAPGAAAAPKRNWMGPLAGLAAGLGIAALLSHFGMGEGVANFLMIALLAVAAFFVIRLLMRRFMPQPAAAGMNRMPAAGGAQVAWPTPAAPASAAPASTEPAMAPSAPIAFTPAAPVAASSAAPVGRAFVPAAFDSEGFSRIARTLFVRLQAANDSGNLDDLRRFTTPEMFAEIRVDLQERKGQTQSTDVVEVDAQVLDVVQEATQQIVSVRYHGLVREAAGAEPERFDEVWHLVQPQGQEGWLIAGIEQQPTPKG